VQPKDRVIGYFVDLRTNVLAEGAVTQWMHAFPFGQYKHPLYGKIIMTPEKARQMAEGVNDKIREIDIAIDYDHEPGKAAGWVKAAEVRDSGLWLFVEWTPTAVESLRKGEYRYFSPEIMGEWTHPKTGVVYKNVLTGGGLTNKPFLKDILPVNLSEVLGGEWQYDVEGNVIFNDRIVVHKLGGEMDLLKKIASALGITLADDANEEAVIAAFQALKPKEALSESVIQSLVESNPQVRSLVEALQMSEQRIVVLEATNRLSTVNQRLSEWHAGGEKKKFGLPVSLDEKIRGFMLSLNDKQGEVFAEVVTKLQETGFVPMGETLVRSRTPETAGDVTAEVERKMTEIIAAAKTKNITMSEGDALTQLFRDDEELYKRYRDSSYAIEAQGGEA
jgi:hypothetical protein